MINNKNNKNNNNAIIPQKKIQNDNKTVDKS